MLESDFTSEDGILGLIGESGCGKSVTFRCIAGIMSPDEGYISVDDKVFYDSKKGINLPPQERKVGYLFQNYGLFPHMTVEENIYCGIHSHKEVTDKKQVVHDIICKMQLQGLEKHRPNQLSGGQQQRVALARILIGSPRILLLDEPMSALDSYLKSQVMIELKEILQDFGKHTIVVTHSIEEVAELCAKVAVMSAGRIVTLDNTQTILSNPKTVVGAKLIGCKNIALAKKVGEHCIEAPEWGIRLETKEKVMDTLYAVGILERHFQLMECTNQSTVNCFNIEILEEMESVEDRIYKFRFHNESNKKTSLWLRMRKEKENIKKPNSVKIGFGDILQLEKNYQ